MIKIYTDKPMPIKEALEYMTDDFCDSQYCDQTVMDLRDACGALVKTISKLVELMERSDLEEFGIDCKPVTNGEWFPAIEKAKRLIS